ncbi:hypothetical protein QBC44DRAFT_327287 [Cladorrhinum sp. PSN332]|nr:hypothetical protein QBC44DRAFT_327287 [Cladorrhinum sp. PSN332]
MTIVNAGRPDCCQGGPEANHIPVLQSVDDQQDYACIDSFDEDSDDEDDNYETILDDNSRLSHLLESLEQLMYTQIKTKSLGRTRSGRLKRRCPSQFRDTFPERPKRQRSEETKTESEDDYYREQRALSDGEDSDGYGVKILAPPPRSRPMHVPTPSPPPTIRLTTSGEFACPCYKSNPSKYRLCLVASLTTAAQVKQHIETSHRRAEYCPRCYAEFKGKGACEVRRDHIIARECALNRGPSTVEGVHGDLMDRLSEWQPAAARLRHPQKQWDAIWRIVFPGEPVPPTPYLEERDNYVKVLRSVRTFGEREGSEMVKRFLRENRFELEAVLGVAWQDSEELRRLQRGVVERVLKRFLKEA